MTPTTTTRTAISSNTSTEVDRPDALGCCDAAADGVGVSSEVVAVDDTAAEVDTGRLGVGEGPPVASANDVTSSPTAGVPAGSAKESPGLL